MNAARGATNPVLESKEEEEGRPISPPSPPRPRRLGSSHFVTLCVRRRF